MDLGVGDGRNALYFLKKGSHVTEVDMSSRGLENLRKKVQDKNIADQLALIESDVLDLKIIGQFDIILGIGLLYFLEYLNIKTLIKRVKNHTTAGGINVFATRIQQNPMSNLPFIFGHDDLKVFCYKLSKLSIRHKMMRDYTEIYC